MRLTGDYSRENIVDGLLFRPDSADHVGVLSCAFRCDTLLLYYERKSVIGSDQSADQSFERRLSRVNRTSRGWIDGFARSYMSCAFELERL